MKPSLIATIALLVISLVLVSAISMSEEGFFGGSSVPGVGQTNDRGTFTMYYADWCPHCQNVKPLFKEFMGSGIVEVNGIPVKVAMKEEKEIEKEITHEAAAKESALDRALVREEREAKIDIAHVLEVEIEKEIW